VRPHRVFCSSSQASVCSSSSDTPPYAKAEVWERCKCRPERSCTAGTNTDVVLLRRLRREARLESTTGDTAVTELPERLIQRRRLQGKRPPIRR
jgi:hypothetical protein